MYDPKRDGFESYNVAIAAKRAQLLQERCPTAKRVEVIGQCEPFIAILHKDALREIIERDRKAGK